MSWDVLLQRFPEGTTAPEDVPDDYSPPAVGSRAEVAKALRKLFRGPDRSNSGHVTIERHGFTIEIDTGDKEPCEQLLLHIRGNQRKALSAVMRIADHFQMRALNCGDGTFVERSEAESKELARDREIEQGFRNRIQELERNPVARPEFPLPGLTEDRCARDIYLTLKIGESPKKLQKMVYQHWSALFQQRGGLQASVMGPSFLLTLPDGELFCDFSVARRPVMVGETEEQMIPHVEEGAKLLKEFGIATGRNVGRIESATTFVCEDGRRIPLAECTYQQLWTDADYSMKAKAKA